MYVNTPYMDCMGKGFLHILAISHARFEQSDS